MVEFINPFDFKKIYYDYLLGNPALLSLGLIVLISFLSAYFQISPRNFGLILVISSILFAFYVGQGLFFLIILVVGFVLFKGFARMFT